MRTHIFVSQKVQDEHKSISEEIERIFRERLAGEFPQVPRKDDLKRLTKERILNESELEALNDERITEFWREKCRFICVTSDDDKIVDYIAEAIINYCIPCVIIKGREDYPPFIRIIRKIIKKEAGFEQKCFEKECIKRMFYEVTMDSDIKGAILWINNFYHALKDGMEDKVKESINNIMRENRAKREEAAEKTTKIITS